MLLSGKNAFVLVGTDGVGAAIAEVLRAEGAGVVATDLSGVEVGAAFEAARGTLGGVDILVNAVTDWDVLGVAGWGADAWRRLSERNAGVAASAAQAALAGLRRPGAVCFVSTTWSMATSPEMGLIGASKAAIGPITKALALEGATSGLRANAVVMGLIDTPQLRGVVDSRRARAAGQADASLFDASVQRVPMRRAGTAQEVAKAVAFLCSDHARMINGASVLVDGGLLYA